MLPYLTLQDARPNLLVLAERNGVLLVGLLAFLAVLGRVGGRRRGVVRAGVGVREELAEVLRVGVGELLGDQSLVQGTQGVGPLAGQRS